MTSTPRRRVRLLMEALEARCLPSASGAVQAQAIPNDPRYGSLWNMPKIGAPAAWDRTTGRAAVVVADTDSGIDYNHPDLYKNVWINQAEIPADRRPNLTDVDGDRLITFYDLNTPLNQGPGRIADQNGNGRIDAGDLLARWRADGTGGWANGVSEDAAAEQADLGRAFVDDVVGWDFWNNDNDPADDNGHGTHTAGTIGALGNNGLGVAGVAWAVSILPVKIIGPTNGDGNFPVAAAGVRYAAAKGAPVANNSWGGSGGSPELHSALAFARARGQLFVAAAMNNGVNNDTSPLRAYPASYDFDHVVAVAATDIRDAKPRWSNYGRVSVDLAAPGVDVWSTVPVGTGTDGGDYAPGSGTSMAAPHVAGAAALLLARNPGLTYPQLRSLLLGNIDKVTALAKVTATGGRLNVARALNATPLPAVSAGAGSPTTARSPTAALSLNAGSEPIGRPQPPVLAGSPAPVPVFAAPVSSLPERPTDADVTAPPAHGRLAVRDDVRRRAVPFRDVGRDLVEHDGADGL